MFLAQLLIFAQNGDKKLFSLDDLLNIAKKKDPRIESDKIALDIMRNQVDIVTSVLYPKLSYYFGIAPMGSVDGPAKGSVSDMDFDTIGYGLQSKLKIAQPLYTFGKASTAIDMAEKGVDIYKIKYEKTVADAKKDVITAYQALVLMDEILDIVSYGEKQLSKAQKHLKKMEKNDDPNFEQNDLFKVEIYKAKIEQERDELINNRELIRYGLIQFLELPTDFKTLDRDIKLPDYVVLKSDESDFDDDFGEEDSEFSDDTTDNIENDNKTIEKSETNSSEENSSKDEKKVHNFSDVEPIGKLNKNSENIEKFKKTFDYRQLSLLVDINSLDVSLKKRWFTPNILLVADWNYKYSNVAIEQDGYDPYHGNSAVVALVLQWDFDFALFYNQFEKSKLTYFQNKQRLEALEKLSKVELFKYQKESENLLRKVESTKKISKESKKWFVGNAADYYVGVGKAKDLLESLAAYQKAKIDVLRAIYDYNMKEIALKHYLGEL